MQSKILLLVVCAALIFAELLTAGASAQRRRKPQARESASKVQSASVELTDQGYQPASLKLRRGVPARVTFTRKVSATCATEIMIPDYAIRRALPLNEPVVVEFTPNKAGTFDFACGMGMLRGTMMVR